MKMLLRRAHLWLLLRAVSALFLALSATVALNTSVSARAADPITVSSQSQNVHFPDYIDFTLSASDSAAPITQAYIHISIPNNADDVETPAFQPARTVHLTWRETTSGQNFLVPGTPIDYYWQLSDALGNTYTTSDVKFNTIDSRFSWQSISNNIIHIHWYNRSQSFGQLLLNKAQADRQHLVQTLDIDYVQPIDLWIYSNDQDFRPALGPDTPEWVGGVAFPSLNEAFFTVETSLDETLVRDMPHEMTHLLLHEIISPDVDVPTWFDEGLAVYAQIYHEPEMTDRLNEALQQHSLLPLSELDNSFPNDADLAYLAYAQSWNLVDYMYRTFGRTLMARLIYWLQNGTLTFDQDLVTVIGEDERHLENQWHLYLHQPPTLTPAEMQTPAAQPTAPATAPQPRLVLPATTDRSEFTLTTLGALLMLAGLIGLATFVVMLRRQRWQTQAALQQVEQILTASRTALTLPSLPPDAFADRTQPNSSFFQPLQAFGPAREAEAPPGGGEMPPAWPQSPPPPRQQPSWDDAHLPHWPMPQE
jgi:hypothetical protein